MFKAHAINPQIDRNLGTKAPLCLAKILMPNVKISTLMISHKFKALY
jgi:hypothetical protein